VTKSFTATGLALPVDEGKLDWDTPVREVLPEFRLRDPVASEQTTLRDLLTHRTRRLQRHRAGAGAEPPHRSRDAGPGRLTTGLAC
jgi:CubicO group peptidase (beta-lactamase class C family)